jgi:hypothetical protein
MGSTVGNFLTFIGGGLVGLLALALQWALFTLADVAAGLILVALQ